MDRVTYHRARGLFGFSPEGGTSLPVCVSHRIWAITPNTPKQPGDSPRVLSRLFGFSPEGGTSLPVCVSHRIWAITPNTPKQPGDSPRVLSRGQSPHSF